MLFRRQTVIDSTIAANAHGRGVHHKCTSPWIIGVVCLSVIPMLMTLIGLAQEKASDKVSSNAEPAFDEASLEFFEKEVRPILTARCLECHAAGKGTRNGGLRLDARSEILKGGDTGPAIVPGKPSESLLISAINYGDVYQMPPKSKMPAKEIATLTKWVEMGAPWPKEAASAGTVKPFDLATRKAEHWCWQAIKNEAPPAVKNSSWPAASVDHFILAKLEAKSLNPAPQADRLTLLRRVYFDLIGLPPSVEEIDAYMKDESPQALEKVVDRLLSSVHFGERWARHWLDLVRYAETRGHEFEPIIPNAWQYRDYVIRALNADVPYDHFVREHIAGDLIETPRMHPERKTNESVLGTGFWFLGEEVHSPVDIRKDETDRMDNRLDVLSKTFLGLTVSCARCHDHKFDAISQRDYYALAGFAISGSYRQVRVDTEDQHRAIAAKLDLLRAQERTKVSGSLIEAAKPTLDKLDQYLIAAKQLLDSGIKSEEAPLPQVTNDIVFADFEGDSWGEWKSEGTSFGAKPPRKADNEYNAPLDGFVGERFANSHSNGPAGNNNAGVRDAHVGKLISPKFRIERKSIQFRIGGGNHPTRTYIALIVDGKTARTATGQNSGTLRQDEWQVSDLVGKEAHIEIVDDERGGWGHVLVDHIVFTDTKPSRATPAARQRRLVAESRTKSGRLAAEKKLDAEILARWVVELETARSDKRHPLSGLLDRGADNPKPATLVSDASNLVVDFADLPEDLLMQDGVSFGLKPVSPGWLQWRGPLDQQDLSVSTIGGWDRDLFWKDIRLAPGVEDDNGALGNWHRHGRMVRTPEFTLTKGTVWSLVRGSVRSYAAVNSHLIVVGPLHGALLREFKHDKPNDWRWVGHSLEGYRGHRLHIEFSPADDDDCAIAMVVQADSPPPLPSPTWSFFDEFVQANQAFEQRAKSYAEAIRAASASMALTDIFNSTTERQRQMNGRWAEVANWFVQHRNLFAKDWQPPAIDTADIDQLAKTVQWESHLAPAMLEGNGFNEQFLVRGNSSTPKEPVPRRFLEVFGNTGQPQAAVIPSPPSSGERARVRGPGGEPASEIAKAPLPSGRETRERQSADRPPHPNPLLPKTGGEGTRMESSGRLELAHDVLTSPLAARVAVNRVWHHLFGRGIVPSVDNFGVLGQPPSNVELLDHLAMQFVKEGWSQKRLIKSLILSRTYQMSSKPDPAAETVDPDNTLWHRMPIKRLEGEVIRDSLLAVSGRLNPKAFGPSVAIHLTPFMQGRGRPGNSGPVDGDGRRSIYISVRRNFLSPMMLAFDTPNPFSTVGRRTVSNVPAQALILMNDPLVIEQAKRWSDRLLADSTQTADQRIESMYLTAFARRPTDAEKSEALSFLTSYSGSSEQNPANANKAPREAWTDLCHVLFNVKEFIYVE